MFHHFKKTTTALAIFSLAFCCTSDASVTIATVPVGNPGNAGDVHYHGTYGAVDYDYRIGTTEVTNAQYTEFLNSVATSDPYGLYHIFMDSRTDGGITRSGSPDSYTYIVKANAVGQGPGGTDYTFGDKPVTYVSWYDSIRFANWLHNGQGSGDTETGAYTLLGGTPTPSNGNSIARNPGAIWHLTSHDEWYKAAYHKNDSVTGNYWEYPTSSNSVPNNNLPSADTGNSANFWVDGPTTGNTSYPLTDAGAYMLSPSPYGTFDQGGNVWELSDDLIDLEGGTRVMRGGRWNGSSYPMEASSLWGGQSPIGQGENIGFRVARIFTIPVDLEADFNSDDKVDEVDLGIWGTNFGIVDPFGRPVHEFGDADEDSDIDGNDFLIWQMENGIGVVSSASSASIPEPATLLLAMLGLAGACCWRRSKA